MVTAFLFAVLGFEHEAAYASRICLRRCYCNTRSLGSTDRRQKQNRKN